MIVNNDLTMERGQRFLPALTNEVYVHSSVVLDGTPGVVDVSYDIPLAMITSPYGTVLQRPRQRLEPSLQVAQGACVVGLFEQELTGQAERMPSHIVPVEDVAMPDTEIIQSSLSNLTHMIVHPDHTSGMKTEELEGTPFEGFRGSVLPIGEHLPYISERIGEREIFEVTGFIDSDKKLVEWDSSRGINGWLVDLTIVNAYLSSNLELSLLRYAIHSGTLNGLLSSNDTVQLYLEHFDAQTTGEVQFLPSDEPTKHSHMNRFPKITPKEHRRYMKLLSEMSQSRKIR